MGLHPVRPRPNALAHCLTNYGTNQDFEQREKTLTDAAAKREENLLSRLARLEETESAAIRSQAVAEAAMFELQSQLAQAISLRKVARC